MTRWVPYEQLRDMANWWMRVTAQLGDMAKQVRVDSAVTPLLNSFTFAAGTPVVATGELYGHVNIITGVNGHSLGGYLATAFTRLFYLADAGVGIDASLVRGSVILGGGSDTLIGIENLGGTDAADRLVGDANDNRIEGYGGGDILSGGRGNDVLAEGIGSDTYLFSAGDGKDILVDRDAATGHTDMLTLTDIDQTQLWFRHVGNDLQINVLGTADQISVKDWYVGGVSGADNHIERIRTADGRTLYDSDVDKLVHAMAAFAPPQAGQTRWTNGQASNAQVLLAVTH